MSDGIQRGSTETRQNKNKEQNVSRRMEEGTAKLPHCEPLSLTVPPGVPFQIHSSPQIVIAHRGASAHLPEHSLEGYRLALELGADYIEPDLVATADHHLVAMHSLDLSVTTNVEQVFGASKNKTRSKYKMDIVDSDSEAIGYWVYDFTLAELKQLRLKQRLGGAEKNGRTKAFDGLFEIPTLTEILELLNDWNENIQPLWYHDSTEFMQSHNFEKGPHRYPPPPRGLYAELKDFPWLLKDANINLVDLFFDHIRDEPSVWEKALLRNMCDTKKMREHEYRLPPLVMQSFEVEVLKNFTSRWNELAHNDNNEELSYELNSNGETFHIPLPTPPTILLVSHDKCLEEKFWFEMEDSYRKVITGIGPDKMCFFKTNNDNTMGYEPTVMRKATELGWMVHPWTMRPEEAFFATSTNEGRKTRNLDERTSLVPFQNVLEELLFLKCTARVDGVFSESVDVAVRAMGMACPDGKARKGHNGGNSGTGTTTGSSNSTTLSFDTNEIPLGPVIAFSFVSGILAALLLLKFCGGARSRSKASNNGQQSQPPSQTRRAPRIPGRRSSNLPPHSAIPTEAADDDDIQMVVLDETDREIL